MIQEPDAGVISDSMKAHPISTGPGPWRLYAVDSCKALKVSLRGRFDKIPVLLGWPGDVVSEPDKRS